MQTLSGRRFGDQTRGALESAVSRIQALLDHWRVRARCAAARSELRQLDARCLRDIGIDRSEFESCFAESFRIADLTRRRIARRSR